MSSWTVLLLSIVFQLTQFKTECTYSWHKSSFVKRIDNDRCFESESLICDPYQLLSSSSLKSLELSIDDFISSSPCICNSSCGVTWSGLSQRVVIGVLLLDNLSRLDQNDLDKMRRSIQLGSCPDNDVLLIVDRQKALLSYGSLLSGSIITDECSERLVKRFNPNYSLTSNVKRILRLFRGMITNPCMCHFCSTTFSWFKIPAMLMACFWLLLWLSLIGRRAYVRRQLGLLGTGTDLAVIRRRYHRSASFYLRHPSITSNLSVSPRQRALLLEQQRRLRRRSRRLLEAAAASSAGDSDRTSSSSGCGDVEATRDRVGSTDRTANNPLSVPPPPYSSVVKLSLDEEEAPSGCCLDVNDSTSNHHSNALLSESAGNSSDHRPTQTLDYDRPPPLVSNDDAPPPYSSIDNLPANTHPDSSSGERS